MSDTDYASQLLGQSSAEASKPVDYASQLLGGKDIGSSVMNPPVESEAQGASFGALTKAAMVDNPETQMRIFAKSRFPKLKEEEALQRYGIINGDIVYLDTDGKVKKESPSGFTGFLKEGAANIIAQAPSVIGGTAGAILGAVGGPATAAAGAAIGATGGKAISQVAGNLIYDEPQTPKGNIKGMMIEGGLSGATTYVGSKLAKVIGERNAARDISKLNRPEAEALVNKALGIGVDLNAAQSTNLPSLRGRYEALSRLESSMDLLDTARRTQAGQAANAVSNYTAGISDQVVSPKVAGEGAKTGAAEILDRIAIDRATAANPLYQKALNATISNDPQTLAELKALTNTSAYKAGLARAMKIASNDGLDLKSDQNMMRVLHYVKLGIGDMLDKTSAVKEGIGSTERRSVVGVQNRLVAFMDSQSPEYAQARSVYGHYMPTLKASREGMLGELADLAETDVNTAAKRVFAPQNAPEDVRKLRSMFFRYDQSTAWNAMLKSHLQDTFEQAGREFATAGGPVSQAPKWRAMMAGDPKQLAIIRASLTEPQLRGFNDMMDVFQAIGRSSGTGGSQSTPLAVANEQLRFEAMGLSAKVLQPIRTVYDWLSEARLGKHAEEMARVMTDPDALNKLKQLRQTSVINNQFWARFSSLFGIGKESNQTAEDRPIQAR